MNMSDIYEGAARFINDLIRDEFRAQGHTLTGAFEESLTGKYTKFAKSDRLEGFGLSYGMEVNRGLEPHQISDKMYPGLVNYFILRGLTHPEAMKAATFTIRKWKQEGMSTQKSKEYSSTGARQNFVEAAFTGNDHVIDDFVLNLVDFAFEEQFKKVKSEII